MTRSGVANGSGPSFGQAAIPILTVNYGTPHKGKFKGSGGGPPQHGILLLPQTFVFAQKTPF